MSDRPLRVLMLATYFPKPGNALLGTWALDQAQALVRAGAEVTVISLTPWVPRWPGQRSGARAYSECPAEAKWGNLVAHYPRWLNYPLGGFAKVYRRRPALWLRLAWPGCRAEVLRLARSIQPEVIFAHHTSVNGWVAARLGAELQVPFVTQDHAVWEVADYSEMFPAYRRIFQDVARKAALMLGVSRRMTDDIRSVAPDARVAVLHNGANLAAPSAAAANAGPRPPVIFSTGMLVGWKGFDVLLRAWARVCRDFPDARLRIAGDGPEREPLAALTRELGVTDSVQWLGYVAHKTVQLEMAAARAFALASWRETFAVVYFEAAAAAAPLVWCSNSGNAEVFVSGTHGLAIEPHDVESTASALATLLRDPSGAAAMGRAAQQLVREQFTWDAVAQRAVRLLSECAANPARPRA